MVNVRVRKLWGGWASMSMTKEKLAEIRGRVKKANQTKSWVN